MGILSSLFSSTETVKDVTNGVINGIDKAWYTDEERAEGFNTLLKLYEPFKIAQRYLALILSIPFVVVWLLVALMLVIGGLVPPGEVVQGSITYSQHIVESAKALGQLNNETLGLPVSLVLSFYFAGGALEGVVGKFTNKKRD